VCFRRQVIYIPEVSEVLKFAWIQYLGVLVVIYYLVDAVQAFVFSAQVSPVPMVLILPQALKSPLNAVLSLQVFETSVSSDLTVGSKSHRF
jgi:hypothetical protein